MRHNLLLLSRRGGDAGDPNQGNHRRVHRLQRAGGPAPSRSDRRLHDVRGTLSAVQPRRFVASLLSLCFSSPSLPLSLSLRRTHTHTLPLPPSHSHSLTLSLSHSHSHSLTLVLRSTHTLALSLSLSLPLPLSPLFPDLSHSFSSPTRHE